MTHEMTRRALLGSAVGIAATTVTANPVHLMLLDSKTESLVKETLETFLQVDKVPMEIVRQFIVRLMTPGLHTETPETFLGWLNHGDGYEENLKPYLLEEFIAHSNYFAVIAGEEDKLAFKGGAPYIDESLGLVS